MTSRKQCEGRWLIDGSSKSIMVDSEWDELNVM